jgi:hypothetical protein
LLPSCVSFTLEIKLTVVTKKRYNCYLGGSGRAHDCVVCVLNWYFVPFVCFIYIGKYHRAVKRGDKIATREGVGEYDSWGGVVRVWWGGGGAAGGQ